MNESPGFWGRLLRQVEKLETKSIGFFPYILSLWAIMFTRNLLEAYSSTGFTEQAGSYLLHYPLAYIAPLLALAAALSLLSKVPVIRVTRLMLYVWLLTLLPPLLDMLIAKGTGGEKAQIGYLAIAPGEYWTTFVNFFNPRADLKGTTAGIRLEALLACLLSLVYVWTKSRSITRALVTPLVIFALSFFFFTFPHVYLAAVRSFHPAVTDFTGLFLTKGILARTDSSRLSLLMAQVDLLLTAVVALAWFGLWLGRRALTQLVGLVVSGDSLFALVMATAGFFLGWRVLLPHEPLGNVLSHHSDVLSLVSILLAAVSASAALITLRGRELWPEGAGGGLIGLVFALFAAANTLVVGFPPFCFLLLFLSAGVVREMPPFELRSRPLLSSLALSLGGVALASMGYCLFASSRTPSYFPKGVLSGLFVTLTIGFFAKEHWRSRGKDGKAGESRLPARAVSLFGLALLVSVCALSYDDLPRLGDVRWGTPDQTRHAELGSMFASEGRRDHARIEYEEAVRLGSPDPLVYSELGLEYARQGQTLLAIDMFQKATDMDPGIGEAHYNLGLAYAQAEMEDQAAQSFDRALSLLPDRPEVRLGSLAFLTEHDRLPEAISLLLSGTMGMREEQVLAFEAMQRAAQKMQDASFDTSSMGGRFLSRFTGAMRNASQGRWEEALGELASLRAEFQNILPILYYQAWALQMRGNLEKAGAAYELFLAEVPGVYEARVNLGIAYTGQGRLLEARAIFESILEEKPGDARALVSLAATYTKEGKLEESLALLERALEKDPASYLVRMNLGIVLEGLSRTEEAIAQYQALIISGQETPELYVKLAGCYMRKGDLSRARGSLLEALKLDPGYAPAQNALASLSKQENVPREGTR